jgi:hypothetical protein
MRSARRSEPRKQRGDKPLSLGEPLMRSVIYSMSVSLDGYIAGPDGSFDWTTPDEEVFRFFTDQTRELAAHVMGRRLYETIAVVGDGRPKSGAGL